MNTQSLSFFSQRGIKTICSALLLLFIAALFIIVGFSPLRGVVHPYHGFGDFVGFGLLLSSVAAICGTVGLILLFIGLTKLFGRVSIGSSLLILAFLVILYNASPLDKLLASILERQLTRPLYDLFIISSYYWSLLIIPAVISGVIMIITGIYAKRTAAV